MRIDRVEVRREHLPLTKPYTIARETIADVELFFVLVHADGAIGIGCASPAPNVTGESPDACAAALAGAAELLTGREASAVGTLGRALEAAFPAAPAARAACDMALFDLLGRRLGVPVVDLLGRVQEGLPTSVTIGIMSAAEAVAQARDYLAQGFTTLKVKLGHDVEEDIDRVRRLRAVLGPAVTIRTDINAWYTLAALERYLAATADLGLELCEQPLARGRDGELAALPAPVRARLAADESVHDARDAAALAQEPRPYGIHVIKLMKCGGIAPARRIATVAEAAGLELMWGCMDESAVSIAAALHTALASPATRYLDLDGSFDLARDFVTGGFVLEGGRLRPAPGPGLGVEPLG